MTTDELRAYLVAAGERITLVDTISELTLARIQGIALRTMRDRRTRQGDAPPFRLNGRSCVYELADVAAYLTRRKSTAESVNEWQSGRMRAA